MKKIIKKITILCSCILLLLTIIFSIQTSLKQTYGASEKVYITINFDENVTNVKCDELDINVSTSGEIILVSTNHLEYLFEVTLKDGYKISDVTINATEEEILEGTYFLPVILSNNSFSIETYAGGLPSMVITSEPISSEQPTMPYGYRLLTKDDEGKTFGVNLEPTIYIDTNFIDDYYEWDTVTLLESPKINVDGYANDVGKFYFKDILFYNDYDSFDLSAVETINSMVLNDTITGFNDSYTGSSSSGALAWNNFLYVKDKITEETTYSVSGAWLFNEEINYSNDFVENVNFNFGSYSSGFTTFKCQIIDDELELVCIRSTEELSSYSSSATEPGIGYPDNNPDYGVSNEIIFYSATSGWISSEGRYINFGEEEQEVSKEFYNFLISNATQLEETPDFYSLVVFSNGVNVSVDSTTFLAGEDITLTLLPSENYEVNNSNISISGTYETYSYDKNTNKIVIYNATSNITLSLVETLIPTYQEVYDYSLKINLLDLIEENNSLCLKVNIPLSLTDELQLASVNISKTEDLDIKNYKLTLLEEKSNEEYSIYLVENFILETGKTRFYVIPSIFRNYNETIDGEQAEDQTITEKAIEVSAKYTFEDDSKGTKVTYSGIEVITVTNKYVGFVRYENGFLSLKSSCDAHFIAFSTDLDIDKLLEADVYYTTQSYSYRKGGTIIITENETYGDINENYVHLTNGETAEYLPGGWFSQYYSWYRITSVEDFISYLKGLNIGVDDNSQLDDETMQELLKNSWVLSFAETEYYEGIINTATATNGIDKTIVGDVSILRLAFETAGEYYNLAVVDDKTEGSSEPVVTKEPDFDLLKKIKELFESFGEKIKLIIGLVLLVLLFVVLWPILSPIISIVIKAIFNILKFILFLPIKIIKLIKGGRK